MGSEPSSAVVAVAIVLIHGWARRKSGDVVDEVRVAALIGLDEQTIQKSLNEWKICGAGQM